MPFTHHKPTPLSLEPLPPPPPPPSMGQSTSNPTITTIWKRAFAKGKSDDANLYGNGNQTYPLLPPPPPLPPPLPPSSPSARTPKQLITHVFTSSKKIQPLPPPQIPLPSIPPPTHPYQNHQHLLHHNNNNHTPHHHRQPSVIPPSPAFMNTSEADRTTITSAPPPQPSELENHPLFPIRSSSLREKSDDLESKEDWRKSDATVTTAVPLVTNDVHHHHQQQQQHWDSRPTSVAESMHSTHTVVPTDNHTRKAPPTALQLTDDDDEDDEDDDLSGFHRHPTNNLIQLGNQYDPSASVPSSPSSSSSVLRDQSTHNIRGRLAAWTANMSSSSLSNSHHRGYQPPYLHQPPHPPPPPPPSVSHPARQPAISLTGAFAPLAKRAVEKMSRALGGIASGSTSGGSSGYSSSSSSSPSPFSSSTYLAAPDRYYAQQPQVFGTGPGLISFEHPTTKPRRTPNAPSSSWSVVSVGEADVGIAHQHHSQASMSSIATMATGNTGPYMGVQLRGPIMSSGMVFGRDLKTCWRETPVVSRVQAGKGAGKEKYLRSLEKRRVPAIVVRCVQHLLLWGVQEEGLFRVNGRPFHVSKLRGEFDTGADYDMSECSPGELDPHAVASVFKAYLRELPEPILTRGLTPFFDAAMAAEHHSAELTSPPSVPRPLKGPSLPSSVRSGMPMRKPPSLTTLAMPSFTGMKPPSEPLLKAMRALLARLPRENRDLIRTVVELIKATAKESGRTKMPLSNLLLVFCPSLNMNPPLLRVLCEGVGIWEDEDGTGTGAKAGPHLDVVGPTRLDDVVESVVEMVMEDVKTPTPKALEEKKEDSSSRGTSPDTDTRPPPLSSSSESIDTPSTSSSAVFSNLALSIAVDHVDFDHKKHEEESSTLAVSLPDPVSPRKLTISAPISSPVRFPDMMMPSNPSPITVRRRSSIPHLSLPSFNIHSSEPTSPSPLTPVRSRGFRKPSLQLLFGSKPSSATSLVTSFSPYAQLSVPSPSKPGSDSSSVSTPTSAFTAQSSTSNSPPVLDTNIDSSPILLGVMGIDEEKFDTIKSKSVVPPPKLEKTSSAASSSSYAGKTPIADLFLTPSSSFHSLLAPSEPAPPVPPVPIIERTPSTQAATSTTPTDPAPAPAPAAAATVTPDVTTVTINSASTKTSTSTIKTITLAPTQPLRFTPSKASVSSLNHLANVTHLRDEGIMNSDDEAREDWTKSVLLAADLNAEWLFQRGSGAENTSQVRT